MIGVPLTDIQILIVIHTYVMSMLKDRVCNAEGGLEGTILIYRCGSPGTRDDFIVFVQDGDKTGITVYLFTGRVFGPADTGIDVLPIGYGPADIHTGKVDTPDEFPIQREDLKTILFAGSTDQDW